MSHVVSPEERARRLILVILADLPDIDAAKDRAAEICDEYISEGADHPKGGSRYFYEVYYHIVKYK